jgi:hypothetical protein
MVRLPIPRATPAGLNTRIGCVKLAPRIAPMMRE